MAHALREKAAISGIGETAYTRGTQKSGLALQLEASLKAIEDAGLSPRDIDGVVPYFPGGGIAEDFIANLGLPDLTLSLFVPMGGATCVAAIQSAAMAVATGVCKNVLISVGRTGYSGARVVDAPAAVSAVRPGQRVRGADRHVRAGPALRPGRAPPHGALRHHRRATSPRSRSRRASTPSSTATW